MKAIVLLLAAMSAPPAVELTTVDGEDVSGALTQITAEGVSLQAEDGPRMIPIASVLSIRAAGEETAPEQESAGTIVQFQGGGSLSCKDLAIRDRRLVASPLAGDSIDVPLESVAALRFRAADPAVATAWQEVVESAPARDLLVVRNGDVLDRVEGTISALDAKTLTFLVGDQRVAIDRTKPRLFGIVAAHSANQEEKTICEVRLRNGDWLGVSGLTFDGRQLSVAASGWETALPWESVAELDFGRGRIRYLSDLEPRESSHTSYFGTKLDEVFDVLLDHGNDGPETPIRIENHAFRKGIVIHSRTKLLYRLNGEYQRFVTVAGIEDSVRPLGSVKLTITVDGKNVLEKTITGHDGPVSIDLDVSGVRELSILVDFADDLDTADHLALGDARFIK